MSIKRLNPYLTFNGTAGKAIQLYEQALGARTEGLVMVSDSMPDKPVPAGTNVSVCLDFDDVPDMTKKFEALARGGKVTMPLQDTFWGARFGMLTDAFGIAWMFNCTTRKQG